MASWQAHLITWVLKQVVKRRPAKSVDVAELRRRFHRGVYSPVPIPNGWQLQEVKQGPLRGEWIKPLGKAQGCLLYLHGGGYLFCSPRTHRHLTVALAVQTGMRCLSLDYRLAPEYPFPAAVEDALAAYNALITQGVPSTQIMLAGDSAGGGLALATMIALRDAELPLPAGAALLSPLTDLAATGASLVENSLRDAMFYGETVKAFAHLYLGTASPLNPLASPLYAEMAGFPPLLLHVSNSEILRDDALRLFERARQQHVPIELKLWSELPHVWQLFSPFVPEADESIVEIAAFLRNCLKAHDHEQYIHEDS